MFRLTEDLRFFIYNGKVNLRRGCMSLCELIRTEMKSDPRDGRNVYIFMNRARTIVRLIHYESGFYIMYEKRPESEKFRRPVYDSKSCRYKIFYTDLVCLTEGPDLRTAPAAEQPRGGPAWPRQGRLRRQRAGDICRRVRAGGCLKETEKEKVGGSQALNRRIRMRACGVSSDRQLLQASKQPLRTTHEADQA